MKMMSEFREGMWAVVQQAISTLDTDFVTYADERLGSCERLAADREFEQWLDDAANPMTDRAPRPDARRGRLAPTAPRLVRSTPTWLQRCVELALDGEQFLLGALHLRAFEPLLAAERQ